LFYKPATIMRTLYLLFLTVVLSQTCLGQKLDMQLNSINPVIKNDQHGDSVRKYFSITFYRYPSSDPSLKINKTHTRHLWMNTFYSNKLAVKYNYALKKIPELRKYFNDNLSSGLTQPFDGYTGSYAIPIFDTTGIIITVNGINHQNADQYQFRVLENKTKIVLPWTKPKLFTERYWMTKIVDSTKVDEEVAYLGQFKEAFGKALTFEVRRVDQPEVTQVTMSALWVKWQPKVIGVFSFTQLEDFLKIVKRQWMPVITLNDGEWNVDSTRLKLKKTFPPEENSLIFYLDDIVNDKKIVEYELINGQSGEGWRQNDFDLNFILLKNLSPGNYKLRIRYSVQRDNVIEYDFTVKPAWYQTIWAKLTFGLLGVFSVGFIVLLIRSNRQTKKIAAQDVQKQIVNTELKAIRSQFNPHFVFNALSSIQGLITKNDQENATKYLVEFGTLMRDALKASGSEFTSLPAELKMLENYLRLEQLRFGFAYEFFIDEQLPVNGIEIPSLLLQPIVENAIKHGISALQENGRLIISFEKDGANMHVSVTDNGKGFNNAAPTNGFGLQLTRDRIRFLNQTLDGQQITFTIKRVDEQTLVIISFENLLI